MIAYGDLLDATNPSERAYEGVPLATCGAKRGTIIEDAVRRFIEQREGVVATVPTGETTHVGTKRGRHNATCDFMIGSVRYEVKSAGLNYHPSRCGWEATWQHIKPNLHDVLILALYSPYGIDMYKHDAMLGVRSNGTRIQISGGRSHIDLSDGLDDIRAKMKHMHIGQLSFDDLGDVTTTRTQSAYLGVSLATRSAKVRGDILERIALRMLSWKFGLVAHEPHMTHCVNGSSRARHCREYDALMGDRRVEIKSSQLTHDGTRWSFRFKSIHPDAYDDLYLVMYTPTGVHVYAHDHVLGVSKCAQSKEWTVILCASRRTKDVATAEREITERLSPMLVASLRW